MCALATIVYGEPRVLSIVQGSSGHSRVWVRAGQGGASLPAGTSTERLRLWVPVQSSAQVDHSDQALTWQVVAFSP